MGEGILDYSTEIIVVQLLLDVASQRIILHESGLIIPLPGSQEGTDFSQVQEALSRQDQDMQKNHHDG